MNDVHLHGNLARDPEVKTVTVGDRQTKVANLTVATTRFFKKKDGVQNKETTFVPCEAWDTGAELMEKLLKKGDPVIVTGSLKMETWEVDGNKRSKMKVRVSNFQKLHRASAPSSESAAVTSETPSSETPPSEEPVAAGVTEGGNGDEIPF